MGHEKTILSTKYFLAGEQEVLRTENKIMGMAVPSLVKRQNHDVTSNDHRLLRPQGTPRQTPRPPGLPGSGYVPSQVRGGSVPCGSRTVVCRNFVGATGCGDAHLGKAIPIILFFSPRTSHQVGKKKWFLIFGVPLHVA